MSEVLIPVHILGMSVKASQLQYAINWQEQIMREMG